MDRLAAAAEKAANDAGKGDDAASDKKGSDDGDDVASSDPGSPSKLEALSGDGAGDDAAAAGDDAAAAAEEEKAEEAPVAPKRKKYLHHPFTENDYAKRRASSEYAKIKEVEDRVLNFKKENVKTYVISAGVLYGLGEAIFNHHFERAWKQDPQKLPIVGEGKNFVPTIHVKDLARMVKKLFEAPPEQQYIFGIDNTKKPTQKKLIQAISDGIGTGLVESIDIPLDYAPVHPKQTPLNLHLDWKKFVMLNIKAKPSKLFVPESAGDGGEDGEGEAAEEDAGGFQWHCKSGLAVNIQRVKEEFCKERGLKPFKIAVSGKPCSGKSFYAAQLAKHYGVPHIHKEQVLHDIENWNKEKQAEYEHKQAEKKRLSDLAAKRESDKKAAAEEAKRLADEAAAAEKAAADADAGSNDGSNAGDDDKSDPGNKPAAAGDDVSNAPVDDDLTAARKAKYEAQMKQLAADEADSDDEFIVLDLKIRVNQFKEENPGQKIDSGLMSEAFRWRLEQNDCQNRGYILDGYPVCYSTALEVFFITPPKPVKKEKKEPESGDEKPDGDDEAADEANDPDAGLEPEEIAKKYAPKFQGGIYPDSVILLRGSDAMIRARAAALSAEDNKKWDSENLERRLGIYNEHNDVSLFQTANNDPMLGHPKMKKHILPLTRFFQEHKTEVFEIECDGNTFEMFESMRVYIERDGRSYNYLSSVKKLNVEREEALVGEEKDAKAAKAAKEAADLATKDNERSALEKLQDNRLSSINQHMEEL